ncbi:MAG TPA: hypothetical protein VGL71_09040 [Urbifossiella sp.]
MAIADFGFPGQKQANVTLRIHLRQPEPDQAFAIVRYRIRYDKETPNGVPENVGEFIKLSPEKPIEVHGRRRENVHLLIVSKEKAATFASANDLAESNAGIRIPLNFDESLPEWYATKFTITYRLEPKASGQFELVRETWRPENQCCVVAILLPLATIFGGVWLVSRIWRNAKKQPPRSPNPFADEK